MKTFVSQYSQRFRSLWAILTVMVVMSLVLVAWGGGATTAAASTKAPTLGLKKAPVVHTVKIMESHGRYFFQPARLTIKAGDVVVWKNVSDAAHTVTSDTGAFNTRGLLTTNHTFKVTFMKVGTFKYHCNIHLYMRATIIVTSSLKKASVVHTVKIMESHGRYFFQPAMLTIKAGDVVVWTNASDAAHTVTSDTGVFNTPGLLTTNHTFKVTFIRAGTFKYHCNIHLYMRATIIVVP